MARDYCFTAWEIPKIDEDAVKYCIYGKEICPDTGKTHWQGFVVFNRTCRIPKAKVWIGCDSAHFEPRYGTRVEAREYCKKDGDFYEYGVLEVLTNNEILKLPIIDIKKNYPMMYVRYHKGIEKLHSIESEKWRDIKVTILWGVTGCGKTRQVMEMDDVYKIDPPYQWWDGYYHETILLIDDYTPNCIARGKFLNLLDGYRLRLETKGGHTWAHWTQVFVTTNYDPINWDSAVLRRVTSVVAVG